jgi:hypothetical protein
MDGTGGFREVIVSCRHAAVAPPQRAAPAPAQSCRCGPPPCALSERSIRSCPCPVASRST